MKILVVSSFLPYPLYSGGNIRLYNLLKELSNDHEFTLIAEKRKYQTEQDVEELKKICKKIITVDRKKQWSVRNILSSCFSVNSFLITGHMLSKMRTIIENELKTENYDFIDIETSYIFQNLPATRLPKLLIAHNVEYLAFKRFAERIKPILALVLSIDVFKLRRFEQVTWKSVQEVIAMSDVEAKVIKNFNQKVTVIPNGVDTEKFKLIHLSKKNSEQKRILFIGNFSWIQNIDSVRFIIKEIWPLVKAKGMKNGIYDLKLWIVGKKIPESIKKLTTDQDIIFDESAPDETEKIYEKALILLSPIRVGAGTQLKILEAMSSGVPVVTTTLGASGLLVENDKDLLVADKASDLAEKIVKILKDRKLYESIAVRARKKVEKNYSWKILAEKLNRVYQTIV